MENSTLSKYLNTFSPIDLAEMEGVKLMNRIDTKYVMRLSQLPALLSAVSKDYYAQEIEGQRIARYDTLYYDTADRDMYMRHHDRQLVRQKIRIRQYVDTGVTFLEIKRKNNKGRTKKKRMAVPGFALKNDTLGQTKRETWSVEDYIAAKSNYEWSALSPHLRTLFDRITLVNKAKTERLTIDMHLTWQNTLTGEERSFPELVIVELKRDGLTKNDGRLAIKDVLRDMRIQPFKISKYCIGTALTTPELKQNRFKEKIRKIDKLCRN